MYTLHTVRGRGANKKIDKQSTTVFIQIQYDLLFLDLGFALTHIHYTIHSIQLKITLLNNRNEYFYRTQYNIYKVVCEKKGC